MLVGLIKNKCRLKQTDKEVFLTTFLNPVSYLKARKNIVIYSQFDSILADGWLFVIALRMVGIKTKRYSFDMTSLAPVVFNKAIELDQSIYFIGSKPDEIKNFIKIIKTNFPALNIKGHRNGYFKNSKERDTTIKDIQILTPDVVIVGMGVPLQEKFLVDLQNAGWEGIGYTCGGFIHQTSRGIYYYPKWVNKLHLRMPYRALKEPHFRKRIPDYLKFVFIFISDYRKYKKQLNHSL